MILSDGGKGVAVLLSTKIKKRGKWVFIKVKVTLITDRV